MEIIGFGFAAKLAATALVVLAATLAAERAGAVVGALIVALPISAGPAYVIIAMEHDSDFVAASATASLALNAVMGPFLLIAAAVTRRHGVAAGFAAAAPVWAAGAALALAPGVSLAAALGLNAVLFLGSMILARRLPAAAGLAKARRGRIDILLRVVGVMCVVAAAILAGRLLGPRFAGVAALVPVVWISTAIVIHGRSGPEACAAILANGVPAMIGFCLALTAVALAAAPLGSAAALLCGLAASLAWSLTLGFRRPVGVGA